MHKITKTLFFLVLFLSIQNIYSQRVRVLPGETFSPRQISNLNRFVKKAFPHLNARSARKKMAQNIKNENQRISEILNWTTQHGVLYVVRAKQHTMSRQVVYENPIMVGFGETPVKALAYYFSQKKLLPGLQENTTMKYSPDNSLYIWISKHQEIIGGKRLEYGYIIGDSYKRLNREALTISASENLRSSLINERKTKLVSGVINSLKEKVNSLEDFNLISESARNLNAKWQKISHLSEKLRKDIRRYNNLQKTKKRIETLQNILSAASIALEISTVTNTDIKSMSGKSSSELIKIAEEFENELQKEIQALQKEIQELNDKSGKVETQLNNHFQQYNIPPSINNDIFIDTTPY